MASAGLVFYCMNRVNYYCLMINQNEVKQAESGCTGVVFYACNRCY